MKPRTLSREEEAELARSNKKVKDINHADFSEGSRDEPWLQRDSGPNTQGKKSFRDKLVGEIPGAFAEAFDLTDQMEEDPDSDDDEVDVGDLTRVGVVAMKLTKETKRRIRGPWSKAIIIKLVGRTIGLSYLQSKLIQLWKPSGRMDCVDLTYGFFLVRFYSKEDLDNMIKKGPWFIGDHFLSLRAWEPFFKPSAANVSLVAVWVRLNELPIELYEPEVLKQIGENIGKVLRIDFHTVMEARGKNARLCIQVDLNKPLINTVIIGRIEQGVMYEGIQRLCFSCGRIGHRADCCPYTIREGKNPLAATEEDQGNQSRKHHAEHEAGRTDDSGGTPNVCEEGEPEGQYGPWMVVRRKRNGSKGATLGKKLEWTGVQARNTSLPPGPNFSGRMSMSEPGPTHRQSMTCEDIHCSPEAQRKKGEPSRGQKFEGPTTSIDSGRSEVLHDGPLKFAAACNTLRPATLSSLGPELGFLAQPHKRFSYLVKGKRAIARGSSSSIANAASSHLTENSLHLYSSPQSSSHKSDQRPDETFEFSAPTKTELGLCTGSSGISGDKSETHSSNESGPRPTEGGAEVQIHQPTDGQASHGGQPAPNSSSFKSGRCGALLDSGSKEGLENTIVDDDSMDSEEGGAASSL
nr:uncharacterized protein CFP56_79677 [Quercus suber]